ncbi:MAG TPA: ABC transporter ATP-binding protein, partial [Candidatus Absconditabacterales bacterium]|nr:ABC transporter ATP-binding protein [Candidatus Absconditabacterales bacterium]
MKKWFIVAIILQFTGEIAAIISPLAGAKIIDMLDSKIIGPDFWYFLGIIFFVAIVDAICSRTNRTIKQYITEKLKIIKTLEYIKNFFLIDYETINTIGTGKVLTRIKNGIDSEITILKNIIDIIYSIVIRGILIIIIFFRTLPWLNALTIISFFIVITIMNLLSKKVEKINKTYNKITEDTGKLTTKIIMEQSTIVLHNKQESEVATLAETYKPLPRLSWQIELRSYISYEIMYIFFEGMKIATYIALGYQIISGTSSVGELVMIITYIGYLRRPINTILNQSSEMKKNMIRYEKLQNFMSIKSKILDGTQEYKHTEGSLKIDNISFNHDKKDSIFENFSYTFKGKKTTALVGHSGSGKSTLIKLLLRLYDPAQGAISADDQDLKTLKRSSRYQHIGYLPQEPAIFDGTVRENLAYSLTDDQLSEK